MFRFAANISEVLLGNVFFSFGLRGQDLLVYTYTLLAQGLRVHGLSLGLRVEDMLLPNRVPPIKVHCRRNFCGSKP